MNTLVYGISANCVLFKNDREESIGVKFHRYRCNCFFMNLYIVFGTLSHLKKCQLRHDFLFNNKHAGFCASFNYVEKGNVIVYNGEKKERPVVCRNR